MIVHYDAVDTPLGPFSMAVDDDGAIIATAFGNKPELHQRLGRNPGDLRAQPLPGLRRQVQEYFAGERTRFDVLCRPEGTAFQRAIWAAVSALPYGQTSSYGALALAAGHPRAARAVGAANGANPICLFIPCHRVIGATGDLTGYAFGSERKRWLLDLESSRQAPPLFRPASVAS